MLFISKFENLYEFDDSRTEFYLGKITESTQYEEYEECFYFWKINKQIEFDESFSRRDSSSYMISI